jgi:hypothetical protein
MTNSALRSSASGGGDVPTIEVLDDEALAEMLLRRDQAAWREFVHRFEPLLRFQVGKTLASAIHVLLDSDAIDDVIGDFYLDIVEADMHKLRYWLFGNRKASLRSWLGKVSTQIAIEHIRRACVRFTASIEKLGRDEQRKREQCDADPKRGGQWLAIQERILGDPVKQRRNRKSNDDKDLPTETKSKRRRKSRSK